jgi:glycosyltransferase involved in cell wall biosynthesis
LSKTIFLYTKSYPYGTGETFIESELKLLAKHFDKIILLPLYSNNGVKRNVPKNVSVVSNDWLKGYNGLRTLFTNIQLFLSLFLYEFRNTENKLVYIRHFGYYKSYLLRHIYIGNSLLTYFEDEKNFSESTHYCYWTESWALAISILIKKNMIKTGISRVHGFDLFLERRKHNTISFRHTQFKYLNSITAASTRAYEYLLENYPAYQTKFNLFPLGIEDNGENPFNKDEVFTLVSCGNVIDIKRVDLIAKALCYIDFPLKWIHFGDGKLIEDVKNEVKKLPKTIKVELKGRIQNSDIIKFYQSTHVSLFIHTSVSEGGVPVSIQEAASFGIPILACDTGGVNEIVNKKTGILLNLDIEAKEVAEYITSFNSFERNSVEFRNGVRNFTLENFLAEKNHTTFIHQILKPSE